MSIGPTDLSEARDLLRCELADAIPMHPEDARFASIVRAIDNLIQVHIVLRGSQ